jgi:tetratricopeptide (TPR) repeat protein
VRIKKSALLLAFFLGATAAATAEVALDEVIQAGRFVLYRDHADQHKYYYVPMEPRLATKPDGTPEFTFIKYTKTDSTTKGGIIHFLVTWGLNEGELSSAESALRLKDPEAKIAGPVPFKEGTFRVVSATAGEGGIFNRRIVGEGKAPIMPGQKAAVSIALTEEGASLLWESFKNPTSDISVDFALKFTGVTPAFQAKLKVNWDKVYTQQDFKLNVGATIKVVKLEADVRAMLEDLRQKGAIELEVVGENENMQKMLDVVYAHLLSIMFDKVPMSPGEAKSPPAKKRPLPALVSELPISQPAWSMTALADVFRAPSECLRGGPFWDQEQVQSTGEEQPRSPCDKQAETNANSFKAKADAMISEEKFLEAIDMLEKAYAACPKPQYRYAIAEIYADILYKIRQAKEYFEAFLSDTTSASGLEEERRRAQSYINDFEEGQRRVKVAIAHYNARRYNEALEEFTWIWDHIGTLEMLWNMGRCYWWLGEPNGDRNNLLNALRCYQGICFIAQGVMNSEDVDKDIADAMEGMEKVFGVLGSEAIHDVDDFRIPATRQAPGLDKALAEKTKLAVEASRKEQKKADTASGAKPLTKEEEQVKGLKSLDTGGGAKPPSSQKTQTPGAKPPAKPTPRAPGANPEVKPLVSVQIGYSFKQVKMSGVYEVDMRKRLRVDRDVPLSGNISGVYEKYGEDKRFFNVVSLDDPTFQERSVEVILDGQDASDFKDYINSVSVLFRKQRFSGAPMTGEVKFIDKQFAQSGNHLSFKYGRLNEASTEWLDYEYKPKWSFYGGVEWEGDWTKTSDSVLTLTPPVRRRTLKISADEDNILKNNIKALAIQIKHRIYDTDILKEVIIDHDKGDPLQIDYTYMHEEGNPGYSYRIIWLFMNGQEIETDWMSKDSPFIYAVFTKK